MDHVVGLELLASVPASSMPEQVEAVDTAERSVRLSGVDLVEGTPVLDIKPYVPDYDCPRAVDYVRVAVSSVEWYCSMVGIFFRCRRCTRRPASCAGAVRGCSRDHSE